jgi:hypothetical protein
MSVESRAPHYIKFMRATEWGINWVRQPFSEKLSDPETYVHHTAGGRMGTFPVMALRELERFSHGRGYSTIAYDVVVHYNVATREVTIAGCREGHRSAATKDRNEQGEAICLMGYFHPGHKLSEKPTTRELEGLAWGIAWMQEQGWSAPDTKILGHRDNPAHPGASDCPGDWLYNDLPFIRRRVMEINLSLKQAPQPEPSDQPIRPPVASTPSTTPRTGDTMSLGYLKHATHDAIYQQFSNGTKTWVKDPGTMEVHKFLNGDKVDVQIMPNNSWMRASGVIVGPRPDGVDAWGCPRK